MRFSTSSNFFIYNIMYNKTKHTNTIHVCASPEGVEGGWTGSRDMWWASTVPGSLGPRNRNT